MTKPDFPGLTWFCFLFGHRLELIWERDVTGECVVMCMRCAEQRAFTIKSEQP